MEGQLFGRYRVSERIAVGGMGEVYAATHELMKREAVVKVLLPEMSAKQGMVKRFFLEAQAAARIEHPGIVELDRKYKDAAKLLKRRKCERLTALTDEIVSYFPDQADDVEPLVSACAELRDRRADGEVTPIVPRRKAARDSNDQLLSIIESETFQDQARAAYKKNQYGETIKYCRKARRASPTELAAASICGFAACRLQDAQKAELYYWMAKPSHRRVIVKICAESGVALALTR